MKTFINHNYFNILMNRKSRPLSQKKKKRKKKQTLKQTLSNNITPFCIRPHRRLKVGLSPVQFDGLPKRKKHTIYTSFLYFNYSLYHFSLEGYTPCNPFFFFWKYLSTITHTYSKNVFSRTMNYGT